MSGHAMWQLMSHYGYVIITIVGVVVVLGLVYQNNRKANAAYRRRAKTDGTREDEL